MTYRTTAVFLALGVALSGGLLGCGPRRGGNGAKPLDCKFVSPQWRDNIKDYAEYTGRTAAVAWSDVKPRVSGMLTKVVFEEKQGTRVKEGDLLFQIDDAPYQAQLKQAEAQTALAKAQMKLTEATYNQADALSKSSKTKNLFSKLQLDTLKAQMDEARAAWDAARAAEKIPRLNVGYTKVTSPISGVVGRANLTKGNVVIQDQTLLTTVVNLDEIDVYFDMDAPTFGKFHKKGAEGPESAKPSPGLAGSISLERPTDPATQGDQEPPRIEGKINFFNNQFNPATDTVLVRGRFDNKPRAENATRLRPGMFVRVRLLIGEPYGALLVPDFAIVSKMGRKYVYVAGPDDKVKEVPVVIGQLLDKTWRVIKPQIDPRTHKPQPDQLTARDRVIVDRLLELQPGQPVRPTLLPITPPGQPAPAEKKGKADKGK
jgi:RND family efflux transporter MFP subunit